MGPFRAKQGFWSSKLCILDTKEGPASSVEVRTSLPSSGRGSLCLRLLITEVEKFQSCNSQQGAGIAEVKLLTGLELEAVAPRRSADLAMNAAAATVA